MSLQNDPHGEETRKRGDKSVAGPVRLLAESQPADQIGISPGVLGLEIVEKPPSLADQLQQPSARVVIFGVGLEVLRQIADAPAEQRDLHLWGASVRLVHLIRADEFGLLIPM